ncbi:MAG: sensor histidine kinase [Terriglobales bacterium]
MAIARQIAGTCMRMQRIVEDCFAYDRLESGETSFQPQLADLDALMRELAAAWVPAFDKKSVRLLVRAEGRLAPFSCDAHKLLRVFSALLENALKFTPGGGETALSWQPCLWTHAQQTSPAACIRVRDTGIGIAPENQLDIFEPFVSFSGCDATPDNTAESGSQGFRRRRDDTAPGLGIGLGLALARRLVQWHGGKIWVESTLNHGSTFSVMLPLRP